MAGSVFTPDHAGDRVFQEPAIISAMSADIQSPDKKILDQAAWSFRRSPEAMKALNWFKDNPEQFRQITQEFDLIIKNMNFILKGDEPANLDNFGGVARLKQALPNLSQAPLPSLEELAETINSQGKKDVLDAITDIFAEVGGGLPEGGAWNWAAKELPRIMGSGLLIEGYARMLARYCHDDAIKRDFVIGFEETGWAFAKEKGIMQDIIPWMKEENGDFSPNVRRALRSEG